MTIEVLDVLLLGCYPAERLVNFDSSIKKNECQMRTILEPTNGEDLVKTMNRCLQLFLNGNNSISLIIHVSTSTAAAAAASAANFCI